MLCFTTCLHCPQGAKKNQFQVQNSPIMTLPSFFCFYFQSFFFNIWSSDIVESIKLHDKEHTTQAWTLPLSSLESWHFLQRRAEIFHKVDSMFYTFIGYPWRKARLIKKLNISSVHAVPPSLPLQMSEIYGYWLTLECLLSGTSGSQQKLGSLNSWLRKCALPNAYTWEVKGRQTVASLFQI